MRSKSRIMYCSIINRSHWELRMSLFIQIFRSCQYLFSLRYLVWLTFLTFNNGNFEDLKNITKSHENFVIYAKLGVKYAILNVIFVLDCALIHMETILAFYLAPKHLLGLNRPNHRCHFLKNGSDNHCQKTFDPLTF